MIYLLALEAIGDDVVALNRGIQQGIPPGPVRRSLDLKPRRPWVARITGGCPNWGLERDFVRGNKDYSRANSKGSRGVMLYYHLREGGVYEVNELESWSTTDRYFCRIEGSGLVRMTEAEALAWLV